MSNNLFVQAVAGSFIRCVNHEKDILILRKHLKESTFQLFPTTSNGNLSSLSG